MVILFAAVALFFILFEFVLRLFWPQNVKVSHMNDLPLVYHDSRLGYVCNRLAHVKVRTPEFTVEYKINGDGLRDASGRAESIHSVKVLLLGASFAFGAANNYEKIWPVIFEKGLKSIGHDVAVIKAGVPFHNTDNDALYLERIFPKYKPDVVILTFMPAILFINTLVQDGIASLTKRPRREDDIIGMNNRIRGLHIATLLKRLLIANDLLYFLIYMRTSRAQLFITPFNDTVKAQMDITQSLLARMAEFCKQRETQFLVLSIPQQFQVIAQARHYQFWNVDVNGIDRLFNEFAEVRGFSWLTSLKELSDQYRVEGSNQFFRLDGHLNNEGNALIGKYLQRSFLVERAKFTKKNLFPDNTEIS